MYINHLFSIADSHRKGKEKQVNNVTPDNKNDGFESS